MAQHIPTKNFEQKRFRDIEHGIRYAFDRSRGLLKTSFRFNFLGEQEGALQSKHEVYTTEMAIPKGIVAGSERGLFEIHYNKNSREIIEIYLVA